MFPIFPQEVSSRSTFNGYICYCKCKIRSYRMLEPEEAVWESIIMIMLGCFWYRRCRLPYPRWDEDLEHLWLVNPDSKYVVNIRGCRVMDNQLLGPCTYWRSLTGSHWAAILNLTSERWLDLFFLHWDIIHLYITVSQFTFISFHLVNYHTLLSIC